MIIMRINIDFGNANTNENKRYRGAGMVSGNNSSRLLMDYKSDCPERYYEILERIFGSSGIGVTHLKLEMGSDINSTSGTEPCIMRYEDEKPDVTRGAGYQLAADVKRLYPEVTLDMLFWSEPAWVTRAEDVFAARYRWYRETLIAAYEKYRLEFDYVSLSRNERDIEPEWIKYAARRLRDEKDCPYDFSAIRIVAADEDNAWWIAEIMADDEELRNAVDIVGSHYTSHAWEKAKLMADSYGKEIWFSEGSPPMNYAKGTSRFDGSGLSGLNGTLDIANRIVAMYPCGRMVLYEYQPVVSAYYDGVTFCHKALINASEPWCGFYSLESGYFMALHFSRFFRKGWCYIDNACFSDSKVGGDGHALVDTVHSFMTACDPESGDYSTVIVNSTDGEITYEFRAENGRKVTVWETRGPDKGEYNENYFRKIREIVPEKIAEKYEYTVTLKPFSMITVSTLDTVEETLPDCMSEILPLPYRDNFDYEESFISERGGMPKYTTDQGGAFEVSDGRLRQVITPETKAMEWGGTPNPMTNLGDDRWYNYIVSAGVILTESEKPEGNYIGAGLRCNLGCSGNNGYSLLIFEDRRWQLRRNAEVVLSGKAEFSPYEINIVSVRADGGFVTAYINGIIVAEYRDDAVLSAGRMALYSSYNRNAFEYIEAVPIEGKSYSITRYDDTDEIFSYSGSWEHNLMSGFACYKRTLSSGQNGAEVSFGFTGTGFGIFGRNDGTAEISVDIDGNRNIVKPSACGDREMFLTESGLAVGEHNVCISVISGTLNIDGVQIEG